jgi:hypothetical protein
MHQVILTSRMFVAGHVHMSGSCRAGAGTFDADSRMPSRTVVPAVMSPLRPCRLMIQPPLDRPMLSADLRPAEVRHSCFGHVLATLIEPCAGPDAPACGSPGRGRRLNWPSASRATTAIYGAGELLLGPVLMMGGALEEMRTMPSLRRYCAKCD